MYQSYVTAPLREVMLVKKKGGQDAFGVTFDYDILQTKKTKINNLNKR